MPSMVIAFCENYLIVLIMSLATGSYVLLTEFQRKQIESAGKTKQRKQYL